MVRTSWTRIVRLISPAIILAAGLIMATGCGEQAVTPPSGSEHLRLWIDDGPDKPATRINISVSETMWIALTVLEAEGEQVRLLHEGVLVAGVHIFVWDARDDAGEVVASGPYWAVLDGGDGLQARAMMLIK